MKKRGLWFGFLLGFLFGIVGIWIVATLSLMFTPVELLTQPLFWVGRFAASLIESNGTVGTLGTVFLFLVNGVFYGVIGVGVQWGMRRWGRMKP